MRMQNKERLLESTLFETLLDLSPTFATIVSLHRRRPRGTRKSNSIGWLSSCSVACAATFGFCLWHNSPTYVDLLVVLFLMSDHVVRS